MFVVVARLQRPATAFRGTGQDVKSGWFDPVPAGARKFISTLNASFTLLQPKDDLLMAH
jgi:hypothetical protein